MANHRIINTEEEYQSALAELDALFDIDPEIGSPDGDLLELLVLLIQDYEKKHYEISLPDPIAAIRFRMEQENLIQRDLVPYIGNRSKVSEILSGKRKLTLSMIRALHFGLGIPASVLLQERDPSVIEQEEIDWKKFPIQEMIKRNWLGEIGESIDNAKNSLENYINQYGDTVVQSVLYRKTSYIRSERPVDRYALASWTARVLHIANEEPLESRYESGTINLNFARNVAQLSSNTQGPLLAKDFLAAHGISLVIEPHLPKTYLDGAAIICCLDNPVIGLTIRYDRLDNFWFCLMHELAHIALHFDLDIKQFFDDLELERQENLREKEADNFAREALIPEDEWKKSPASDFPVPLEVTLLANNLNVNPALVAGRIRYEMKNYRILKDMVGQGQVRSLYENINWNE